MASRAPSSMPARMNVVGSWVSADAKLAISGGRNAPAADLPIQAAAVNASKAGADRREC